MTAYKKYLDNIFIVQITCFDLFMAVIRQMLKTYMRKTHTLYFYPVSDDGL